MHVLKQFVPLFNRNSEALCKRLEALTPRIIDVHDLLSEATVEMLLGEQAGTSVS